MSQVEMWDLIPELKPPEEKHPNYIVEKELYPGYFEWRRATLEIMRNVEDRQGKMIDWTDALRISGEFGYISPKKSNWLFVRKSPRT